MALREWNKLPPFMKVREVRQYYEVLKRHRFELMLKRIFDFIASSVLLVLLSPLLLILSLWIRADSEGPIFYRQARVTQYGRLFRIYKFRTMVNHADQMGGLITARGDTRITRVGEILRGRRLDELPQLINIWKGEMTFVGTRPEVPKYVKQYTSEMYATLLLPAGVTSEASLSFSEENRILGAVDGDLDESYVKTILPEKMRKNLISIKNFSFLRETAVLLRTVKVLFHSN